MAKIKIEHDIDLWVVGKADQHLRVHSPGDTLPGILFSVGQVTLRVGVTKKNEFTLGQGGTISLAGFGYYNNKKSLLKWLKNIGMNVNNFKRPGDWLTFIKQRDECKFTNAFINSIFRITCSNDLWINIYWELIDL